MDDDRNYERLKWTVLDEAGHHHNAGIAYYWARRAYPDLHVDALAPIVQRVLLELLDEGLIEFWWGSWDGGDDVDDEVANTSELLSRAEVNADLARTGGTGGPFPRTVWFKSTDGGEARLAQVMPETLLSFEKQRAFDAFLQRHPEFPQTRENWLQELTRWREEGGRGPPPTPPNLEYDDFPSDR